MFICDHCGLSFTQENSNTFSEAQIIERGPAAWDEKDGKMRPGYIKAICWTCGKTMTFFLKESQVNRDMKQYKRETEKDIYRSLRRKGKDVDRNRDIEEDILDTEQDLREEGG